MADTISRRSLLAGTGAAVLTLDHATRGRLGYNKVAPVATPTPSTRFEAQDWANGTIMQAGGYAESPNLFVLPDGELRATMTISGHEGADNQHIVVMSTPDDGLTWEPLSVIEPPAEVESSWAQPWWIGDRLYVRYTCNADNVRSIPYSDGRAEVKRVDMMGYIAYKSSIDGGATWSERRLLDLPNADIDLRNPFGGEHQLLWASGRPDGWDDEYYIGYGKWGIVGVKDDPNGTMGDTEGFVARVWETEPGVLDCRQSAPIKCPPIAEEAVAIALGHGAVNATFRTATGFLGEAWSGDGGQSWSVDFARDHNGAPIAHPRAIGNQHRLPDGRFLLWHHNMIGWAWPEAPQFGPRNPAFYRIGERVGNRIVWGAPNLLLWDKDPATRMSGPSIVFRDDEMLLAAGDKSSCRLFRFPLAGL